MNTVGVVYNEESIISEITTFSGAIYASGILNSILGFVIMKYLGPAQYGVWAIIVLFIGLTKYISLGASEGMVHQVPYYKGRNQLDRGVKIQKTCFTWGFLFSIVISVCIFILTLTPYIKTYKGEMQLATCVFLLLFIYNFTKSRLLSDNNVTYLSRYVIAVAIINGILSVCMLFIWQIKGLLLALIISHSAIFIFMLSKRYVSYGFYFKKDILSALWKIGTPMVIIYISFYLILRMGNLIVFYLLGQTQSGYYGCTIALFLFVMTFSFSITAVLFPKIMHTYGKTKQKEDIEGYLTRPIRLLSITMPIILGLIFILVDVPITIFLNKYIPAIPCLRIMLLGLFFGSLIIMPVSIVIALKKHLFVMVISLCLCVVSIFLNYGTIRSGHGIEGVASITAIIFFFFSLIANLYALRTLHKQVREIIGRLLIMHYPFLYALGVLWLVWNMLTIANHFVLTSLLRGTIYCIAMIPLIVILNRYENLREAAINIIKVFRRRK